MLVEFSVFPMDGGHMSKDVAQVIAILEEAGLEHRLGPMGTTVEGDWQQVMVAIGRCHEKMLDVHPRVITTIVIDDRKENPHHLNEMVGTVERQLGRSVQH